MHDDKNRFNVRQLAWAELSSLRLQGILPESLEGARVDPAGTPIYDVNGEELFRRIPLAGQRGAAGYADVASNPVFGEPLLGVSMGAAWDAETLTAAAYEAARERFEGKIWRTEMRFVAYSYPKIAAQFLLGDEEVLMLELFTWEPVPPAKKRGRGVPPSNFERWSLVEEMPAKKRRKNVAAFRRRADAWAENLAGKRYDHIAAEAVWELADDSQIYQVFKWVRSRELHYSTRNSDHYPCYELRGQQTGVWCVAASVQMLLDFYRYEYSQVRLAQELGLGTLANPNGLPYADDGDVVTVIEAMTGNALNASMNLTPDWAEFESEIDANRPLISFVPGHSRTVAGYTRSLISIIGQPPYRGLLVYDPSPPNTGVITRWENFNTSSYRRTFTARVTLA